MKKTIYYLLLVFIIQLSSCSSRNSTDLPADIVRNPNSADNPVSSNGLPIISFKEDFHDFGKLVAGEKVTYSFEFTNTGKSTLFISDVASSCGCTIPVFPKKPIKPGEKGNIEVSFDSEGRQGLQNKSISVFSNCQPSVTTIRIQATVVNL